MPLPSEQYAFLAHAIYEPMEAKTVIESDTRNYRVIYTSPPSATNYRGAVVQDQATSQLIVVNKGTEPSSIHDITADLGMGMMGAPTQWPEAARTMRWALGHAADEGIPVSDISITGHSLGGALAQLQAAMPESAGVHAETFNTYGALSMALSPHLHLDAQAAEDRVINHRMYHDPVSKLADPIGRSVYYMDHADYQRHHQGGLSPIGEAGAIAAAHGIGNFWNGDRNEPAAVFAHNYMHDLNHRLLDDVPRGVPMDLSAPWHILGQQERGPVPPLAATAGTDEMFEYLCKAIDQDDRGFMEALRQIGQTHAAQEFHMQAAQQVGMEDRIAALETQLQQAQDQQVAQVQQISGPVMCR
jgi:acetyl esterase/lipase